LIDVKEAVVRVHVLALSARDTKTTAKQKIDLLNAFRTTTLDEGWAQGSQQAEKKA
jgi:hypothetical protein